MRLTRELVKSCDPRHHFYSNRIVNSWNKLPNTVKKAKTVNSFKARYDDNESKP